MNWQGKYCGLICSRAEENKVRNLVISASLWAHSRSEDLQNATIHAVYL